MRYMFDNAFVVEIVHCKVKFFLVISDSPCILAPLHQKNAKNSPLRQKMCCCITKCVLPKAEGI